MGNVYDSPDRTDRSYGRGGQLREDRKWRYYYDSHGNLVLKTMRRMEPSRNAEARDEFLQWQSGDYAYTWQGNGMLRSVTRPDGKTVIFRYDPLGRRIEKVFDGRVYRYLWDGDVILHEWDYAEADRPNTIVTEAGEVTLDRPEPVENLITWVYDSDSYVPTAKIVGDRHYSIISDYIGRPAQAYDDKGNVVWQVDYDIYGNLRNLHGGRRFIPFRQLGQYEDEETGLYYNRFRYYDPKIGNYISQDPIGLAGNNPTLYAFVTDPNLWKDMFGLDVSSGAGRTHVTYHGIKNGKPYTGYASAPSELGLSASEIVSRRYGGDFSQFGGRAPEVLYKGEDISGKHTARGLEQRFYEMDVNKFGKEGVANKQNPVGKNNKNRQSYLDTADSFLEKNKITCS